jgi:hypothetical protein
MNYLADISILEQIQSDQHTKLGISSVSVFNGREFADDDKVIATAGSLNAINQLVNKYFFEEKELQGSGNLYKIYNPNKPEYGNDAGKELTGFAVKKVGSRFRLVSF